MLTISTEVDNIIQSVSEWMSRLEKFMLDKPKT